MANFKKKLNSNRVFLYAGGNDLLGDNIYLYTIQEIQTSIDQTYEPLLPGGSNVLLTLASSATQGAIPSGQFKQQGFQIWKGTSPVNISLTCELVMNESGKNDVVGPIATLQHYAVPSVTENGGLIPPGPSIFRALQGLGSGTKLGGMIQTCLDNATAAGLTKEKGTLDVTIGKFLTLPSMVLEKISCTWSTSFDDELYPIKCTVSLDLKSIEIATTDFISRMYNNIPIQSYNLKDYSNEADQWSSNSEKVETEQTIS